MTRKISVICTGGTIACTTNESGALVPTVSGQQLVDAAQQQLRQQPTGHNRLVDELTFCVHDALQLDSSSIGLPELDTLLAAITEQATDPAVDAVVVTHGTDSMEESAYATALLVHGAPVVFTGAQRSFDHPETDGPGNLAGAIRRAVELLPTNAVEVHFGGQNLPATAVHKRHTAELAAFIAHGSAAVVPKFATLPSLSGFRVPVLAGYPGATAELLDYAVDTGVDGVVIEALGSGNMSAELGQAAQRALRHGIPVIVATRVPHGAVQLAYGGGGGGATLAEHGAISARTVHPGQARLALIIALATGTAPEELFRCFD